MLTKPAIRSLYDRAGVRQERASFYHDATAAELLARAPVPDATAVVEFGCGTGRFAERLLTEHLPPTAKYLGLDISRVMVDLTRDRLAPQRARVEVVHTDGCIRFPVADHTQDAVFSNYVLDLLTEEDISRFLAEAARVLRPEGLLGLTGLGRGARPGPRLVAHGWHWVHRVRPALVGGCRPLSMGPRLREPDWDLRYAGLHDRWCVPSEIVVASRLAAA